MSARPILFSGAMVRAILAGGKTQTRRVVKPQPPYGCEYAINGAQSAAVLQSGEVTFVPPTPRSNDHLLPCPYGAPGDTLWVRETWAARLDVDPTADVEKARHYLRFAADGEDLSNARHDYGGRWRPSIHMPRWASRLTLRVTSVRVERLHAITEDDARAEGVASWWERATYDEARGISARWDHISAHRGWGKTQPDFRGAFGALWSRINGAASWDANPWVWVVEFERVGAAP